MAGLTSEFDLVIFNFETGDSDCPWWQEFALVNRKQFDYAKLEDIITSYFKSDACEDNDHDECVKDILNTAEWEWKMFPFYSGCEIYDVHTYWV